MRRGTSAHLLLRAAVSVDRAAPAGSIAASSMPASVSSACPRRVKDSDEGRSTLLTALAAMAPAGLASSPGAPGASWRAGRRRSWRLRVSGSMV